MATGLLTSRKVHCLLLLLLGSLAFGNALGNGFAWDDSLFLLNIDSYRHLELSRFFLGLGNGVEYLPIKDLSYALDFAIWGENPAGFHATSLVIYLFSIIAIYGLAETLIVVVQSNTPAVSSSSARTTSFLTAALFALHPLHSETVNFIGGGRNTLLAGLFCFLSARFFILFVARCSYRNLLFSYGLFVLAVLSKATAVSLPLFFLALFPLMGSRTKGKQLAATLPFYAITAAVYFAYTSIAAKTGAIDPFVRLHVPLAGRLATAVQVPFFYLWKLIAPLGLSVDYGIVFSSWTTSPHAVSAAIALAIAGVISYRCRNELPGYWLAFCWYLATLLPVMQLLPSGMSVADRYAYLPSFAFCLVLADIFPRLYRWRTAPAIAGLLFLLLAYGSLSFQYNRVWKSNHDLWNYTLSVSPNSIQAMNNLGLEYYIVGKYQKCFEYLDRARQLSPLEPSYFFFKGHYYYTRSNFADALGAFQQALSIKPDLIDALFYIGQICENIDNREGAVEYYRRVMASSGLDRAGYKKMAAARLEHLLLSGHK